MKQDKATTQVHEICKHCGKSYTVKERIRIYGDNPFMAGYCSAGCYTEGSLMPAITSNPGKAMNHLIDAMADKIRKDEASPSIPVNDELDIESNGNWLADGRVITLEDDYSYEIAKFERHGECKAAVEAYNETYQKGYNPAAMEELYKELADVIPVLQYKGDCETVIERIKTALHNAKTIKP